jgi:hypothetical protein
VGVEEGLVLLMCIPIVVLGLWCLIVLIWDAIASWPREARPRKLPKPPKPPIDPNQRDWMEDFSAWMLRRGWKFQAKPPAPDANIAVGAHRLSGSALSRANEDSRFR